MRNTINACQRLPNHLYNAFEKKILMKMKIKYCRHFLNHKQTETYIKQLMYNHISTRNQQSLL